MGMSMSMQFPKEVADPKKDVPSVARTSMKFMLATSSDEPPGTVAESCVLISSLIVF